MDGRSGGLLEAPGVSYGDASEICGERACAGLVEVAGIVEAMNLGAVRAEHYAVRARVALENVPEMGVVEPEKRT